MPYIKQEDRKYLDNIVNDIIINGMKPGNLNYLLHKLYVEYEKQYGRKYVNMQMFEGELFMTILEIYARRVYPYEKIKCRQNGDVE